MPKITCENLTSRGYDLANCCASCHSFPTEMALNKEEVIFCCKSVLFAHNLATEEYGFTHNDCDPQFIAWVSKVFGASSKEFYFNLED